MGEVSAFKEFFFYLVLVIQNNRLRITYTIWYWETYGTSFKIQNDKTTFTQVSFFKLHSQKNYQIFTICLAKILELYIQLKSAKQTQKSEVTH
jgi:hypothetical protein